MKIRVQRGSIGVLLAGAGALASCSSDSSMSQNNTNGTQVQALASLAFSPSGVSVAVGGTVTWVFGSVGHNVTFEAVPDAPAEIAGANSNTSISRTFSTAGTYNYHCNIHPSMTGFVIVGGSSVLPPPPPPPPPPPAGYQKGADTIRDKG